MRISKEGLLIVIAILVPVVVEFRTALSWFGIEVTAMESLLVGLVLAAAIVAWAMWPPNGDADAADRS